jgi:hypothetical protein
VLADCSAVRCVDVSTLVPPRMTASYAGLPETADADEEASSSPSASAAQPVVNEARQTKARIAAWKESFIVPTM